MDAILILEVNVHVLHPFRLPTWRRKGESGLPLAVRTDKPECLFVHGAAEQLADRTVMNVIGLVIKWCSSLVY